MPAAVILLAGGKGIRLGEKTPKQFLTFQGKILARHSFDLFLDIQLFQQIVVVCAPDFEHVFSLNGSTASLYFATPGKERQDSVWNGLEKIHPSIKWVVIHDAARPLLEKKALLDVLATAKKYGASALATCVKNTIKQTDSQGFVSQTHPREQLFEIQTPQVIKKSWLKEGLIKAKKEGIILTDDLSAVELLGHRVKLTLGDPSNIKLTIKEDLNLLNALYLSRKRHEI